MKREKSILLNRTGVDDASETVRLWLEEIGIDPGNIIRIRLTIEDILINVCDHGQEKILAELSLFRRFGTDMLKIRYNGDRFDPGKTADNEVEEFTASLLTRTGILPVWRWRFGRNELTMPVSAPKKRAELFMLGCIAAAAVTGLLSRQVASDTVSFWKYSSYASQYFALKLVSCPAWRAVK